MKSRGIFFLRFLSYLPSYWYTRRSTYGLSFGKVDRKPDTFSILSCRGEGHPPTIPEEVIVMYRRIQFAISFFTVLALFCGLIVPSVTAQDYQMYETQYLKVIPGHDDALRDALAAHNKQFHKEGPFRAEVYWIANGKRTGEYWWVMGPGTFTDFDDRPSGDPHDSDWANRVMSHLDATYNTEYWRLSEDLTYNAENSPDEAQPLFRNRFFEVAEEALFAKVQKQIKAVSAAMDPGKTRAMFRKQFLHRDRRDWAMSQSFTGWSELDETGGASFQETFVSIHGDDSWDTFLEEFDAAVVGREDEWLIHLPKLGGTRRLDDN